jgi:hypothetical protein
MKTTAVSLQPELHHFSLHAKSRSQPGSKHANSNEEAAMSDF